MSSAEKIKRLFKRYLDDTATPEEIREFWQLLSKREDRYPLKQELGQLWKDINEEASPAPLDADKLIKEIHERADRWEKVPVAPGERSLPGWRIAAAAAFLGVVLFAYYMIHARHSPEKQVASTTMQTARDTLNRQSNRAVLILANGRTISLDSAQQGQVAVQGNSQVTKVNSGLLSYDKKSSATPSPVQKTDYNTLRTPKGGTYQLVLPDGSKVWLNAASSIRFPTNFTKRGRRVEITGEAYFEVKSQPGETQSGQTAVPFTVKAGAISVQVLGTHFNIMAYSDAAKIKTTLLTGAVKVIVANGRHARLSPGEQAQINKEGDVEVVKNINLQKTMAWKNHLFWFDDDNIETVMQQISRWYDVDIEVNGNVSQHFTGSIPRDFSIPDVFKVLNKTGKIHYEIKGKKIFVSP